MLKELINTNKLYGYNIGDYDGGKGIVLAESEEEAKNKVKEAYSKHGYEMSELNDIEVWKIQCQSNNFFDDAPEVLEICE